MESTDYTFHWADYLVFSLSLAVSLAIGVYFAISANKTTQDFLMASRQGRVIPVAMSMLASFTSSIFIVGVPAEIYYYGTMFFFVGVGYALFLPVGAHVFVPIFHKMEMTSANEYLEKRFNYAVRVIGAIIFIVLMILYLGTVLYGPALAFEVVLKIPLWLSVIVIGIVCTIYTCIGGLKAVIWTDTLQMIIIYGGLIALIAMGTDRVGGMSEVWSTAVDKGRIIYDEISPDPRTRHTWWTMTIGVFFQYISLAGANQTIIQRYLAIEKKKDSQITLYVALIGALVTLFLVTGVGLVLVKFYEDCDPLVAEQVKSADQIVPLFMMEVMGKYHGLPGLFAASVFSAALSTVSSALNSLAAIVLEDFVRPGFRYFRNQELSDKVSTWSSKGIALIFGAITIGLSYLAPKLGDVLLRIALGIFGTAGGPLMGLFALGIFFPFVNNIGAGVGVIVSIVITYWINVGNLLYVPSAPRLKIGFCLASPDNMTLINTTMVTEATTTESTTTMITSTLLNGSTTTPEPENPLIDLYRVSYLWYGFISIWTAILVGILVSAITCFRKGLKPISRDLVLFGCGFTEEREEEKDLKMDMNGHSLNGNVNPAYNPDFITQF